MKKFMILHFGFEDPTPEIMGLGKVVRVDRRQAGRSGRLQRRARNLKERNRRWGWYPSERQGGGPSNATACNQPESCRLPARFSRGL